MKTVLILFLCITASLAVIPLTPEEKQVFEEKFKSDAKDFVETGLEDYKTATKNGDDLFEHYKQLLDCIKLIRIKISELILSVERVVMILERVGNTMHGNLFNGPINEVSLRIQIKQLIRQLDDYLQESNLNFRRISYAKQWVKRRIALIPSGKLAFDKEKLNDILYHLDHVYQNHDRLSQNDFKFHLMILKTLSDQENLTSNKMENVIEILTESFGIKLRKKWSKNCNFTSSITFKINELIKHYNKDYEPEQLLFACHKSEDVESELN